MSDGFIFLAGMLLGAPLGVIVIAIVSINRGESHE